MFASRKDEIFVTISGRLCSLFCLMKESTNFSRVWITKGKKIIEKSSVIRRKREKQMEMSFNPFFVFSFNNIFLLSFDFLSSFLNDRYRNIVGIRSRRIRAGIGPIIFPISRKLN